MLTKIQISLLTVSVKVFIFFQGDLQELMAFFKAAEMHGDKRYIQATGSQ